MLKTRVWVWTLGLLFTQVFLIFVVRDLVSPLSPGIRQVFQVLLPGFRWLTVSRFLLGLAESFLWGVYAALVLVPIANIFLLKHRHDASLPSQRRHRAAA